MHAAAGVHQTQEAEALPMLSAEQQRVLDMVIAGQSFFFTGCAGQPISDEFSVVHLATSTLLPLCCALSNSHGFSEASLM